MTRRRIFLWMGLSVLFLLSGLSSQGLAKELYKAKQGSTLYTIAQKYGVTVADLKRVNKLKGTALKPGQTLVIPDRNQKTAAKPDRKEKTVATAKAKPSSRTSVYVVRRGDSIHAISKKTGLSVQEIKRINHLRGNALKPGQKLAIVKRSAVREAALRDTASSRKKSSVFDLDDDDLDDEDGLPAEENIGEVEKDTKSSSSLLGIWQTPNEQEMLVKVGKGFLGTPYRLGGSTVRGIDCSAFVSKIYQFFDVILPRTAREQSRVGKAVSRDELAAGDLVFFNTRRSFGHVGIYIGNNEFIHASSGRHDKAVRIDNLDKPYYNKRFIKAVRLKGFDEKSVQLKVQDDQV